MQDVFGLFDIELVCDDLYNSLYNALLEFSKTEDNKDVYAIALDCHSVHGDLCLRFGNKDVRKEIVEYYNNSSNHSPNYCLYGLHGAEYYVGDFGRISFNCNDDLTYFFDMYYFIIINFYYGKRKPPKKLKALDNSGTFKVEFFDDPIQPYAQLIIPDEKDDIYSEISLKYRKYFNEIIFIVTTKLKENLSFINKTDDFIIFALDSAEPWDLHDEFMLKTVDKKLFDKLVNKKNID